MNAVNINTIKGIKADIEKGNRKLKDIAAECRIFERQADEDEAKAAYARLSDCTTRKMFYEVMATI